jgi:fermentation-respiration switch protein FrsA (DUF1100 family)
MAAPHEDDAAQRGQRFRRLLIAALLATVVVLLLIPAPIGFMGLYGMTHAPCQRFSTPDAYGMPYEAVTFPSGDLTYEAHFIPGDTDAVVILAPPYSGDAGGQLDYGQMFHDLGLSVLAMTSRRCLGEAQSLGYLEGDDVAAAYAYLTTRDDVDPERVSVHGFSAAGAASLFGAARTPEIRAVSIMGNYDDFHADFGQARPGDGYVERLSKWGMRRGFAYGAGISVENLQPIRVIEEIVPRPILFIYGTGESSFEGGTADG